jgi:drug/metabolite transporter (DMT)-like permease
VGELAALIAALNWSCVSVLLTRLSARTSPAVLSGLRLSVASCVLPFILLASGQAGDIAAAPRTAIVAMVGSGLLGYGLGDTMYIHALKLEGLQRTFPITTAIFIGLTVVGGAVFLGESVGIGLPVGALLIGAGVYAIVVQGAASGQLEPVAAAAEPALATFAELADDPPAAKGRLANVRGYLFMVATGIVWAVATLWLASGRKDLGAVAAGSLRAPAGAVGLMAFTLATQRKELVAPFRDWRHIGLIAVAGLVGTAFGSLLYVYAVGAAGAGRTAVLNATAPVMGMPLSVLFLGEKLTKRIAIGTAVCVVGVVLVVV